jgi:hypothetical protein
VTATKRLPPTTHIGQQNGNARTCRRAAARCVPRPHRTLSTWVIGVAVRRVAPVPASCLVHSEHSGHRGVASGQVGPPGQTGGPCLIHGFGSSLATHSPSRDGQLHKLAAAAGSGTTQPAVGVQWERRCQDMLPQTQPQAAGLSASRALTCSKSPDYRLRSRTRPVRIEGVRGFKIPSGTSTNERGVANGQQCPRASTASRGAPRGGPRSAAAIYPLVGGAWMFRFREPHGSGLCSV